MNVLRVLQIRKIRVRGKYQTVVVLQQGCMRSQWYAGQDVVVVVVDDSEMNYEANGPYMPCNVYSSGSARTCTHGQDDWTSSVDFDRLRELPVFVKGLP